MSYEQAREHIDQAKSWLTGAEDAYDERSETYCTRMAQVHATLAVAEAALPPTPEGDSAQ